MKLAPSLKPASFLKPMPLFAQAEPLAATPTSSAFEAPRPGSTPGPWFPSALQFARCARNSAVWLAAGAALVLGPGLPQKAAAQAKAEPAYTLTGNAAVVSDYRYRGITQTRFNPALQAAADLVLSNGFYVGAFATNITWIRDAGSGAKGSTELDFYGGFKSEFAKGITGDIGVLRYQYSGNNLKEFDAAVGSAFKFDNPNTTELYGAITFGVASLKYSRSVTSLFGLRNPTTGADSKGSSYWDLSASIDLGGGWTVAPHLGRQVVSGFGGANFTDFSLGVAKDFSGLVLGLTFISVDAKDESNYQAGGKFSGKSGAVASVKYNF